MSYRGDSMEKGNGRATLARKLLLTDPTSADGLRSSMRYTSRDVRTCPPIAMTRNQ